jgi:S1-C subfamily serine protease
MRTLLLIACFLAAPGVLVAEVAAEHLPKPPVEDPFGLGERLALVDHLRDVCKLSPAPDATMEQLVAMYWKFHRKEAEAIRDSASDQAMAADRMRRMRQDLKERYQIDAPADADEAKLGDLLNEARTKANGEAVKKVLDKESARENPATPEESARFAQQDQAAARNRLNGLAQDESSDQADIDRIEKQRQDLAVKDMAAKAELEKLQIAYDEAVTKHNSLVSLYNKKTQEGSTDALDLMEKVQAQRKMIDQAREAVEQQSDEVKKLIASDQELVGKRKRIEERSAARDQRRADEQRKIAGGVGSASSGGPATPGGQAPTPAAGSAQAKLVSGVVLLVVPNRGSGTGFFVTTEGILITNAHVVGSKDAKVVALWDASVKRTAVPMKVVEFNESDDLALLKPESNGSFQPLPMAEVYELSRPLKSVGFPLAGSIAGQLHTSPSDIVVTSGTLSSARKNEAGRVEWIQHDCNIASGNSGGPLIDSASGAVIGINTRVVTPDGQHSHGSEMSLAIPIRKVMDRYAKYLKP